MKKRWATKWELTRLLDLTDAEFKDFVKNRGLPAYTSEGHPIEVPDYAKIALQYNNRIEAITKVASNIKRDFEHKLKSSIFNIDELRTFLKENDLLHLVPQERKTQGGEAQKEDNHSFYFPVPDGTTWEQVTFFIPNENYVDVSYPGKRANIETETLGFAKKKILWELFKYFAREKGTLKPSNSAEPIKANVSNLRKHLKELFPSIKGKPIKDLSKINGYVCIFNISSREE